MPSPDHIEIERKFLVRDEGWRRHPDAGHGVRYRQAYVPTGGGVAVRIRVGDDGAAVLTIKGPTTLEPDGPLRRPEFEVALSVAEANAIVAAICGDAMVEKTRYRLREGERVWEVDEFHGAHEGLVVAEVELQTPEEVVELPDWVGREVTHDRRYSSGWLAQNPAPP